MTSAAQILAGLRAQADPGRAGQDSATRDILGVPALALDLMARDLRGDLPLESRLGLARDLWDSTVQEGCILAAKLLTQARIRPDDGAVWALISEWAQQADSELLADHVAAAGARRLLADPGRLNQIEAWRHSPSVWTRRALLVMTLPYARLTHPKPRDLAVREQVLGWAEGFVMDSDPMMQKALQRWLRDLSRRDPQRVAVFLKTPGAESLDRGGLRTG